MKTTEDQCLGEILAFLGQFPRLNCHRWPRPAVVNYLCAQAARNCLRVVYAPGPYGREVTGLAIGWRMQRRHLADADFVAQPWRFAFDDESAEVFYVDLLAARPGATATIVADLQWRFPQWRRWEMACLRRGKLRVFPAEKYLTRLEGL